MESSAISKRLSLLIISAALVTAALLSQGPENVISMISRVPTGAIVFIVCLFAMNIIIVSWRLKLILSHFGVNLPIRTVFRANVAGHYAGLFVHPLVGHVVGRDYVLRHHGVSPILIAALGFYEKSVLLFVGGLLCVVGMVNLGNKVIFREFLPNIPYIQMVIISISGFAICYILWRSKFESLLFSKIASRKTLFGLTAVISITTVANLLVITSFVIGALSFYPNAELVDVFSAAAVISFAASLPLTINGWGVREIAAIYLLGLLGIIGSAALALSIVVGLSATAVILLAMLILFLRKNDRRSTYIEAASFRGNFDINKVAAWVISTLTAILVFFQLHVTFPGGTINLNVADPFAILALAVVLVHWISDRRLPHWRYDSFNTLILGFSLLLAFGFIRGVLEIGVTQWALTGRLIGWLVIVGYLAAGYLAVAYLGSQGLRKMTEKMITIAFLIVIFNVAKYIASSFDLISGLNLNSNFRGFAGNRVAFAFQMVTCSALILVYSLLRFNPNKKITAPDIIAPALLFSLMHGVILNGLVFTASRAGLIAESLLLIYVFFMRTANRKFMMLSIAAAISIWLLTNLPLESHAQPQGPLSSEASTEQHFTIITKSLDMWLESPIFGSGLGVFYEKSVAWFDQHFVIHSVPFWFLAEFGLFGVVIVTAILILLIRHMQNSGLSQLPIKLLSSLLLVFIVFGLFHDMFYQRIFWLLLGSCMAVGGAEYSKSTR